MKSNALYSHRRGSIIITLMGALIFITIFYSTYCFKQWQANRHGARFRAAHQARQQPAKDHRWPSPDRRLAFKLPPVFAWGRRTSKLVEHDTGRVLLESKFEADIARCIWREDSKACAVEYDVQSGGNEVVLLLIDGDQVTRCRPADVIKPDRLLPDQDRQLGMRWEHSVELIDFRDGDVQIRWTGVAKLMHQGHPIRVTRAQCEFKLGYTPVGDVFVVESVPLSDPQTFAW